MEEQDELIGVEQLAKQLSVPVSWVYSQSASGNLPSLKIGKYVRFRPSDVTRWLQQRSSR
jgi:excisionase family DNA binding protein